MHVVTKSKSLRCYSKAQLCINQYETSTSHLQSNPTRDYTFEFSAGHISIPLAKSANAPPYPVAQVLFNWAIQLRGLKCSPPLHATHPCRIVCGLSFKGLKTKKRADQISILPASCLILLLLVLLIPLVAVLFSVQGCYFAIHGHNHQSKLKIDDTLKYNADLVYFHLGWSHKLRSNHLFCKTRQAPSLHVERPLGSCYMIKYSKP